MNSHYSSVFFTSQTVETIAQFGVRTNTSLFSFPTESLKADQEKEKEKQVIQCIFFWASPNANQKDEEKKKKEF